MSLQSNMVEIPLFKTDLFSNQSQQQTSLDSSCTFRDDDGMVYNLMVGAFSDLQDVKQALLALQPSFDSIRIRRLGAVQKEWCSKVDNLTPDQLLLVVEKCA